MSKVAAPNGECNTNVELNVECGGETFPVAVYQALSPIVWRGTTWAVTEYGIERLDGRYWIESKRLIENAPSYSWPEHIAEKGEGWDLPDFIEAWKEALEEYLGIDEKLQAYIDRSIVKATERALAAEIYKANHGRYLAIRYSDLSERERRGHSMCVSVMCKISNTEAMTDGALQTLADEDRAAAAKAAAERAVEEEIKSLLLECTPAAAAKLLGHDHDKVLKMLHVVAGTDVDAANKALRLLKEADTTERAKEPATEPSRFEIYDTWAFKDRPEPQWQVDRLIRDKATTIIFGRSESYKTFGIIDLLASTATGLPAFGHFEVKRPGDTVLCLAEDPDDAMRGRFPAWCKSRGIADPFGKPLLLPDGTPSPGRFVIIGDVPLVSNHTNIEALVQAIRKAGLNPVHIAIDTVAKAMGGLNQNDAQDVGLLVAAMTRLRREFDCSVTAAHHPNKADEENMRGSGALTNDVDCIIHARATGELSAILEFQKFKGGQKPPPILLRGELHDVGLPQRFPAFTFQREVIEKREERQPEKIDPADTLRSPIINYLLTATKTEADWLDTGTIAANLWPMQDDEEPTDYEKRKAKRMTELEKYAVGKSGAGAGKLSGLIKKTREGDAHIPTRWYLRARLREGAGVELSYRSTGHGSGVGRAGIPSRCWATHILFLQSVLALRGVLTALSPPWLQMDKSWLCCWPYGLGCICFQ